MAGRIPQNFIDDLLDRTDIVDVVGDHVQLRKAGKDFQGLCPFHNEKTPSFTVSQVKQFYHCFGCGANGSAVGFLMEYNHLNFVDSVHELAKRAGMEVPVDTASAPRQNNDPVYKITQDASVFFKAQLRQHPQKQRAITYLKNRGLDGKTAAAFGIGFAPPGWDNLITALSPSTETLALMVKAGLIVEKEAGGHYDRFRDRITFPIHDLRGRVIGFGGRVINPDDQPKYLNSPETPIFQKGRELYGLFEARQRNKNLENIIVVEGYMDVVALGQFGITNATATLGTATTPDHLQRLFKSTSEIVFCFDGDNAGRRAAWKALQIALPFLLDGRSVRFLFMPDGEDPDSLIRDRGAAYFQAAENTTPLSDHLIDTLSRNIDLSGPEGRAQLVSKLSPMINQLPNGAFKLLLKQRAQDLTGVDLNQLSPPPSSQPNGPTPPVAPPRSRPTLQNRQRTRSVAAKTIHLLLTHPELLSSHALPEELVMLDHPDIPLLLDVAQQISQTPQISTGQLLESWRERDTYPQIQMLVPGIRGMNEVMIQSEYAGLVESLRGKLVKQQRKAIVQTADGKISDQFRDLYKR